MQPVIYADNAATTQLNPAAFDAMAPYLLEAYGNASQPYAFSRKPKKALAQARADIAACIGARPEEIFFTSGGTESDNWVIKGVAQAQAEARAPGAIVTSQFEHHAVLHACDAVQKLGCGVQTVTPNAQGYITPQALRASLTGPVRLVSILYANNEIGTIQPIKELCRVAHAQGAWFHTDAVQAVGHVALDVQDLGVDFLSASAHKFNGPKGIGFLYIRKGLSLPNLLDGGGQESGHRAGTENVAAIVGMAAALKANCAELTKNQQHILALEDSLLKALSQSGIPFKRNGGDQKLPGLLSLSFPGRDGEALLHRMDLMGISISTGSACNSQSTQVSHVLRAIGLDDSYAKGTIRISLGKYNTLEDAAAIAAALLKCLRPVN